MSDTALITSGEFDPEVNLRIQGDARLATFTGLVLGGGIPGAAAPAYSAHGALVDAVDGRPLTQAVYDLDAGKNSRQSLARGSDPVLSNPRSLVFDSVFQVTPVDGGDGAYLSLQGEVEWADQDTTTAITVNESLQGFANKGFCAGAYLSYVTIGRISATYRVVAGITLLGRRGRVVPAREASYHGLVLKRRIVVTSLTVVTPVSGETRCVVKVFGAGGASAGGAVGGAGGFSHADFPPTAPFTCLPGAVGAGYGGAAGAGGGAGGGGSFVWNGSVTPSASLDTNLLAVAGGGGGAKSAGTPAAGGHGNAAGGGGQPDHQGAAGDGTHPGGGGGYRGGGQGLGGSGFHWAYNGDASGYGRLAAQHGSGAGGPAVNPGAYDPDYLPGYGGAGEPGLIVVSLWG